MPNAVYPNALEAFLQAEINMSSDDIRVVLVDTGAYTYAGTHEFLSDIGASARIATSAADATSKTFADGVFDCDDTVIAGVSGATVEAIVLYQHTGSDSTARLIAYIDTTSNASLPLTPNGGSVTITYDAGGVFSI